MGFVSSLTQYLPKMSAAELGCRSTRRSVGRERFLVYSALADYKSSTIYFDCVVLSSWRSTIRSSDGIGAQIPCDCATTLPRYLNTIDRHLFGIRIESRSFQKKAR